MSLLSLLLPPAVLLLWFWVVGAPVVALGLYIARHRVSAPGVELTAGSNAGLGSGLAHGLGPGLSPGLGARLGFLSGLAILLALALVNTISLLLVRYGLHKTAGRHGPLAILFPQRGAPAEALYGAAAAVPFLGLLRVPEFRAGLLLSSLLLFTTGYLLLTTLGGAFAGLLRRNSTSPS